MDDEGVDRMWDLVDDEGVIGCGIWWMMRVWLFFFC